MTIIRWANPTNYGDVFENLFARTSQQIDQKNCDCVPASNIAETETAFEIELAVAGYNKDDIQIALENNILSVFCDKDQLENKEVNYTRREFGYGTFRRSFSLPKSVDSEKIAAAYTNGILKLTLPKRETSKDRLTRQIAIS